MKILDPGHLYELSHLDGDGTSILKFVKRIGENFPGNDWPPHEGVTTQEVLRALIDRTKYVDGQHRHDFNSQAIAALREALERYEARAASKRHQWLHYDSTRKNGRWEGLGIESLPTCATCGHIGCLSHGGMK